jgi:signal transduction histidine kinase
MMAKPWTTRRIWGWAFATATAMTILNTTQDYASRTVESLPANWLRLLRLPALDWYAWALLTPVVFALGRRAPRRRTRDMVLFWIAAGLALMALHSLIEVAAARSLGFVSNAMPFWTMLSARFTGTLASSGVLFCVLVLAATTIRQNEETHARMQRESELQGQLAQARLRGLESQLQPHFLFNTLHTVSALMAEDVASARRVLTRLGDLLRESLTPAASHEATLADELTFVEKYLDIERVRFRDRLRVHLAVEPMLESALVPRFMLQPLVENALRYAIAPRAGPGTIWMRAFREGDTVRVEVEDDGPGIAAAPARGEGVGLTNTRARLAHLYGAAARLDVRAGSNGGFAVSIVIPYNAAPRGRAT